jgi:hypothetical protein
MVNPAPEKKIQLIDVEKVLNSKNPALGKYIPSFVFN